MRNLPNYLVSGEDARLIPVISESNKEQRLLSPVLAAMAIVPEFTSEILGAMGVKVRKTTKIRTLTEVVFKNDKSELDRPDGLIILTTSGREYRLLIEAKSRNADLDLEQICKYLEIARSHGVDAVVTISNQFTANPKHSPVKVPSRLLNRVDLFHISWSFISTNIDLLIGQNSIEDDERGLILREIQRYLSHHSSGVGGFTQMNKEWKDVVKAISSGSKIRKNNDGLQATVSSWHQEQKDMCLMLSRHLLSDVVLQLPRKYKASSAEWVKATLEELLDSNCLTAKIAVPDAVSILSVSVNLARKTATNSVKLKAPEDKKSAKARVNWLLRQMSEVKDSRFEVRMHYSGSKPHYTVNLLDLKENTSLSDDGSGGIPNYFEILFHDELGSNFSGSKKFIEIIEKNLTIFYDQGVIGLKAWQPSAPKPVKIYEEEVIEVDVVPEIDSAD